MLRIKIRKIYLPKWHLTRNYFNGFYSLKGMGTFYVNGQVVGFGFIDWMRNDTIYHYLNIYNYRSMRNQYEGD
jgi:hypothetical protein